MRNTLVRQAWVASLLVGVATAYGTGLAGIRTLAPGSGAEAWISFGLGGIASVCYVVWTLGLFAQRRRLPSTQVIATTHTPLVIAGAADVEGAQVMRLAMGKDSAIVADGIPREALRGRRADQILVSVFGLWSTRSPGSVGDADRHAALLSPSGNSATAAMPTRSPRGSSSGRSHSAGEARSRRARRVARTTRFAEESPRRAKKPASSTSGGDGPPMIRRRRRE